MVATVKVVENLKISKIDVEKIVITKNEKVVFEATSPFYSVSVFVFRVYLLILSQEQ